MLYQFQCEDVLPVPGKGYDRVFLRPLTTPAGADEAPVCERLEKRPHDFRKGKVYQEGPWTEIPDYGK